MHAKDSLINLRLHQNKRQLPAARPSKRRLPIEELRAVVDAKRARTSGKQVRFAFEKNVIHIEDKTDEELAACWMSRSEAEEARARTIGTIEAFRAGQLSSDDCLRGLELLSSPELVEKKLENGRNFVMVILEQQGFLQSIMGKANDLILGRMSAVLSAEDAKDAVQTAACDAQEASRIYEGAIAVVPTTTLKTAVGERPKEALVSLLTTL